MRLHRKYKLLFMREVVYYLYPIIKSNHNVQAMNEKKLINIVFYRVLNTSTAQCKSLFCDGKVLETQMTYTRGEL